MSIKKYGKPKFSIIFGFCIFVGIISPFVFKSTGFSYVLGIGFSLLWCSPIVIGTIIRRGLYMREIQSFKHGKTLNRKYHVSTNHMISDLDTIMSNKIAPTLEEIIINHKMLWHRMGNTFVCFTNIFSEWHIKIMIEFIEEKKDRFNLSFSFTDRYMQPVMINWMKKRYKAEMDRIFNSFKVIILEKVKH
jgi:hypothetical protein